jgi:polyphenol oxidase
LDSKTKDNHLSKVKTMIKVPEHTPLFLQSELLNQQKGIVHFFSTRYAGFEQSERILQHFKLKTEQLVIGKQTHGCNIEIVDRNNHTQKFEQTDAFISSEPGICIVVKTADCTPILMFDPVYRVIAAVHSGWRGTLQNIAGATVRRMHEVYGSNSSTIVAAIGPCIGVNRYEVGDELVNLFSKQFPNQQGIVEPPEKTKEKARVNVRLAIYHQLLLAGISANNIELSGLCTYENSAFWSARRDGAASGRMINGIFLE